MAKAVTAKFEEMVLEVEFDPVGSAGTYTRICGITDVTINRTSNVDTTEVPDCADESKPHYVERAVRSQEVNVSGTGVWSLSANHEMQTWWRSGTTLDTRIRNVKAEDNGDVGDIYEETGPALLVSLNNGRTKGQKVSANIEIQFDGIPTAGVVAI